MGLGRVALVTGSSRGLGRAIAHRLARDGFAVAVNGIDEEETWLVADAIRDDGLTAQAFIADVTDEVQAEELIAAIAERLGPVSVLVLNATGPQPTIPLAEVTWPDHRAMLEFFVKSPVLVGRAALPAMLAARYGRIVTSTPRSRTCRRRQLALLRRQERPEGPGPRVGP